MLNKRIEELAKQCETAYTDQNEDRRIYTEFDKEKFAELIVKECIQLCNSEDDSWCKIAKHFGIKEHSVIEDSNRKFPKGTFVFDQNDFLYQKGLHDGAVIERSKWKLPPDISDTDPN